MKNVLPFIITTFAGISTLIGFLFIYIDKDKEKIIKNSLSFASGVMLCVSIIDLIPESINMLSKSLNKSNVFLYIFISILIGSLIPFIIDKYISKKENDLYRVGLLSMLAIVIHNIPEGIITYLTATTNLKLGITLSIAIALHNVPEGISISVPIYYGTNNKTKAFTMTLISALSEPLGAIIAYIFLKDIITEQIMGIILALTSGIMTNISLIELLPKSLEYKEKKKTIIFFIIGLFFMYISVNIMK